MPKYNKNNNRASTMQALVEEPKFKNVHWKMQLFKLPMYQMFNFSIIFFFISSLFHIISTH